VLFGVAGYWDLLAMCFEFLEKLLVILGRCGFGVGEVSAPAWHLGRGRLSPGWRNGRVSKSCRGEDTTGSGHRCRKLLGNASLV
jgi:hypothetical protein